MSTLAPDCTAILVIDVQHGLFDANPRPFEHERVVTRINELTRRARQSGASVLLVQHDGKAHENLVPFTKGWELHASLVQDPKDLHVRKSTCDAFFETPLEQELRKRGIESLVVAGYATDFCIDSTVRNAASKRFQVFVASDAHTTNDSTILKAEQIVVQRNWAWARCSAGAGIKDV